MMIYPEFLRVRQVLTWGVILIGILLLVDLVATLIYPELAGHVRVSADEGPGLVPFSVVFSGVGFAVAGVATAIGCNLNRYLEQAELVFTLPLSRARFALSVLAIDLAGLLAAFGLATLLIIAVPFTINGIWRHVTFDSAIPIRLALGFGAVFLWFSLLAAVSAWIPGRGGMIAGLSWPFFGLLSVLYRHAGGLGWLRGPILLVNYLNPMRYLSFSNHDGIVRTGIDAPVELQVALVFSFALLACAVAVAGWTRQEI
jgi:hypothetical protein